MDIVLKIIGAYIATITSGIILEIPKSFVFKAGIIGASGYLLFLLAIDKTDVTVATLLGGVLIAVLSHVFARLFKTPVTTFYIPSFFPLVPGVGVYNIAYYYIVGNSKMASQYFVSSVLISGAIAVSIFFVESMIEIINHNIFEGKRKV